MSADVLWERTSLYMGEGGFVMWPLLVAAAVLWYAIGARAVSLLRAGRDGVEPVERQVELTRFRVLIRAIVMVAPLAGLLGTVDGMIETFDALGDMALFTQSGGIAGGVSQALVSTQMGLAVAIPGLVIGRLLDRRQARIETELVW